MCWQIIANCNCISEWFAITEKQFLKEDTSMCANYTSDDRDPTEPEHSFRKLLCSYRVDEDLHTCNCDMPCNEITYDVSVSASGPWPHGSHRDAFINTYVSGTGYGDKIYKLAEDTVSPLNFFY